MIVSIDTDDGTGAIPTNIAVVVGNGGNTTIYGDQVKLRFFDGTVKTVTVDSNGVKGTDTELGQAYKVSGSDSNTKLEKLETNKKYNGYEFISTATTVYGSPAKGEAISDVNGTTSATTKLDKIKTVKVDDNAVIILVSDDGTSKQITGKQFKAITSNDSKLGTAAEAAWSVFTKDVNGLERVMLASVKVTDTDISGISYDNYGYIVSDGVNKANGDVEFRMWTGSENATVKVENATASDYTKGTLVAYSSVDGDGYLKDVVYFGTIETIATSPSSAANAADLKSGSNKADSASSISVDNNSLNVTADTHVLVIDSDANAADDIGQPYTYGTTKLATAAKDADGVNYRTNVIYRGENGGTPADGDDLDLVVVDVTGAFDFDKPESTVTPPAPDTGKTYATADELKAALNDGNVVATGVVPAETYNSTNTLTLKNAVLTDSVIVTGNTVLDGTTTFSSKGTLEVLGTLTINDGASVDLSKVTASGKVVDNRTSTKAADVDTMIKGSNDVTVKAVDGALTTTDLSGKKLTVAGDADLSAVTTTSSTTNVTVNGKATLAATATVKGTWNIGTIAGAATSLTVEGTLTTENAVPAALTITSGTVKTGDVTGAVTVNGGTATIGAAKDDVTVKAGATLNAKSFDWSKTIAGTATSASEKSTINLTGTDAISTTGAETLSGDWTISAPVTLSTSNEWTVAANSSVTFNGNLTFTDADTLKATDATSKFSVKEGVTATTATGETLINKNDTSTAIAEKNIAGASFTGQTSANKWTADKDLDGWNA